MPAKRSRDKAERAYEAMLSRCLTKGQNVANAGASESCSAAESAISLLRDVRRRQRRGEIVDADYLARRTAAEQSRPGRGAKMKSSRTPSGSLYGIAISVLVAVAVGGFLLFRSTGYNVTGTLELKGSPLAGMELVFHSDDPVSSPIRTVTSDRGTFSVGSVPDGRYVICLNPQDDGSFVPKRYCDRTSTPFSLEVHKNLENLRMVIVIGKSG